MDDMKRMIERYKQELMEYSRAAAPKERLEFPEMLSEDAPARSVPAEKDSGENARDNRPGGNEAARADGGTETEEYSDISDFPYFTTGVPDYGDTDSPNGAGNADKSNTAGVTEGTGDPAVADISDSVNSEVSGNGVSSAPSPLPAEEHRRPEIIGYVAPGNGDLNQIISSLVPDDRESAEAPYEEKTDGAGEANGQRSSKPLYGEISSQRETAERNTDESVPENNFPITGEVSGVTGNTSAEPLPEYVEAQSVSPERAEGLNRQPISGQTPGEQLTGRSFDDETPPVNSRDDIKPLNNGAPQEFIEPSYDSYEDFVKKNPASGTLRFRVYTARQALPVKGAVCEITKDIGGKKQTLYRLVTDESGQTETVSLPAPPKSLSQTPDSTEPVFSRFDATVKADGFEDVIYKNIPVFDGVMSLQRVAMIPSAGNGESMVINESGSSANGGD